ncbi:MAG: GNAT family N-acetyltransferase [Candidatus Lokiarchaeota archaeon]|nr:GNAT family N-acetyltransferase [Candidatus Lokiarchaeota archaeon]
MEIIVRPLSSKLIEDFLNFFDNVAFTDNPDWSRCYCQFYHFPGSIKEWKDTSKEENRNASEKLILEERMKGFLAYVNNQPIGWCNVNNKEVYTKIPYEDESEEDTKDKIASIVCFVISPTYRKKGVARFLLQKTIINLRENGFKWLESYPRKGELSDAHSYHGPVSLYSSEGFFVVKETEDFLVMRKNLTNPT